jgi:hypothetical protein
MSPPVEPTTPSPFVVYKYPLDLKATQEVRMPLLARILCVQLQYGRPTLWAMVNREAAAENHVMVPVHMVGTGHAEVPRDADYVGTVQLDEGTLVLHVFHEAHHARQANG